VLAPRVPVITVNIAPVPVNIAEFGAKRSLIPSQIGSLS
jgi:hypothetical protein